jgi:hypothetical protein
VTGLTDRMRPFNGAYLLDHTDDHFGLLQPWFRQISERDTGPSSGHHRRLQASVAGQPWITMDVWDAHIGTRAPRWLMTGLAQDGKLQNRQEPSYFHAPFKATPDKLLQPPTSGWKSDQSQYWSSRVGLPTLEYPQSVCKSQSTECQNNASCVPVYGWFPAACLALAYPVAADSQPASPAQQCSIAEQIFVMWPWTDSCDCARHTWCKFWKVVGGLLLGIMYAGCCICIVTGVSDKVVRLAFLMHRLRYTLCIRGAPYGEGRVHRQPSVHQSAIIARSRCQRTGVIEIVRCPS